MVTLNRRGNNDLRLTGEKYHLTILFFSLSLSLSLSLSHLPFFSLRSLSSHLDSCRRRAPSAAIFGEVRNTGWERDSMVDSEGDGQTTAKVLAVMTKTGSFHAHPGLLGSTTLCHIFSSAGPGGIPAPYSHRYNSHSSNEYHAITSRN